jgi:hypothetical protein
MYTRQRTPLFAIGWLFVAVGALLMFTREERHEVWTILNDAMQALVVQRGAVSNNVQSALEKEKLYVAE